MFKLTKKCNYCILSGIDLLENTVAVAGLTKKKPLANNFTQNFTRKVENQYEL